jgi:hypothetical protein
MEFVDLLKHLHMSAKGGIETFLTYDVVQELPPEQFARLEQLQILVETQAAKYYTCNECADEDCSDISLLPFKDRQTGQTVGLFSCCMEGGEGLKRVDLNRLRRWDILPDKIEAYLASIEPPQHESPKSPAKPIINREEANVAVRQHIQQLKAEMNLESNEDFKQITVRLLADRIGCSQGLISGCSAWKAFKKTRDVKQTTSSKSVRLNAVHLDNLSDDNKPDEIVAQKELQRLISEQKADMENTNNKVFPGR